MLSRGSRPLPGHGGVGEAKGGGRGGIASPLCPLLKNILKLNLKEKTFLLLFQKVNSNHYKLSTKKLEKILTSVIIKARNK